MGLSALRAAADCSWREWAEDTRRGHSKHPTLRGLSAYAEDSFNQRCLLDLTTGEKIYECPLDVWHIFPNLSTFSTLYPFFLLFINSVHQ